jgi:thiol:disulfide interchange protein DsbD
LTLLLSALIFAQSRNPVKWEVGVEPSAVPPGGTAVAKFTGKMEPGWHIYALTTPKGGPTPTTIKLTPENEAISNVRLYQPEPHRLYDANFQMNVEAFENDVTVLAALDVAKDAQAGAQELSFQLRYQACTEKECLPRKITLTANLTVDPNSAASTFTAPEGYQEFTGATPASAKPAEASAPIQAAGSQEEQGLIPFLAIAFGFGLAAIFTPCVFPMIPITLSFFLKRPGVTRGESLKQALLFCLGIIVLFTGMGLAVTAIVGPFGVVQLGSNPWVNGFIAVVFIVFGLSLLGAFEITLPSGLLTRMDQASQRGGMIGTLLMGLTFSLTSFACVGPFVGTLLAGSVQRGGAEPALGMAAFATGLASPFFLLALFPSYLQRMPRSGGWLARVKVVLGFIILAAALKYISSIDQVLQWNILTRERFLAAWFVLFLLPGVYLLGLLRMEGIKGDETLGVGRTLSGAAFLIFAFSLLPGMFGVPLGELDSFVPLGSERSFGASQNAESLQWIKNDFEGALAQARQEEKLVFVSFTGYACTNCHWMKANMLSRPEIREALKGFVLVELYTDGTDAASEANQQLQESTFQTAAIPYYAIFNTEGKAVATFAGLTRRAPEYLAFLRSAGGAQTAQIPGNP